MSAPLARNRGGVHTAVRHDSAVGHVTGRALYLDDVPNVPGTLEAALVLSPHAHARIKNIDVSAALSAPGVVAVITAADIPGVNDIAPIKTNEPLLPVDLVEHEGQPVVAVAAQTLDQARAAAKLVKIDYEPLPAILTIEEAMAKESYVSPPSSKPRHIGCPASFTPAARIISISKARSRWRRRARTAPCTSTARPSTRPRCSTASRICSACRSTR